VTPEQTGNFAALALKAVVATLFWVWLASLLARWTYCTWYVCA